MGILSRFKMIMASNINALLDKAEDPAKAINEYMRSMNMDLGKVKAETASVLADERRAGRALDECREEIDKLQRYAVKSVESGNDGDARRFLERKAVQANKLKSLQAAYDAASLNAANIQNMQDKLVSDMKVLEERRSELKGAWAAAHAQQKMNAVGTEAFKAMEEKVYQAYDEAMALAELNAGAKDDLDERFAQLDKETRASAEDELAEMKERLKKNDGQR